MTLEEFTAKEFEILGDIQAKGLAARETGLKRGVPESGQLAGYLIALRYDQAVREAIGEFSNKVNESLGGRTVTYGVTNAHQTIADYAVRHVEGGFKPDEKVLSKLIDSARTGFKKASLIGNVFGNYISGSDSVIVKPLGSADGRTYSLIQRVADKAANLGIEARGAWGRHMTVNRFTEDIPSEEMGAFNELMWNGNFPANYFPTVSSDGDWLLAKSLDIGYFTMDKTGFNFNVVESLKLQ
jgi:hypothetical protein